MASTVSRITLNPFDKMPESMTAELIVDLSSNTGALKYGASGFLYGLGNAGIPSINMLAPLKPQVVAQKPEGGLQHPNGDAFNVAATFQVAGGREIEIYIQDMYPDWPYTFLGLDNYLGIVERVVRQVAQHSARGRFSFVPFNEPDNIWYNKSDKKDIFFQDWKTVYRKIKSVDAVARIVGPNFANYDSAVYREFLAFARDNACLPTVISWHELNDCFFTNWYARYDDYRNSEYALGITPREICINEYGRKSGDLGVPGKLVQWIARFENSKVDACLAYWTTAGCLNDLVAPDSNNQATGGWWLYKWYGSLTGHTVQVTPPDANAEGLQGLASLDADKKQASVVFGGWSGSVDVVVKGLRSEVFGNEAQVSVWAVQDTGTAPSNGPVCVMQTTYAIVSGQLTVTLKDMLETSAYQLVITPSTSPLTQVSLSQSDDRRCDGARMSFDKASSHPSEGGEGFTAEYGDKSDNAITFVVTARDNGYYTIQIHMNKVKQQSGVRMILNGEPLTEIPLSAGSIKTSTKVFLARGINRLTFERTGRGEPTDIEAIQLSLTSGAVQEYQAAAKENTLSGTAIAVSDPVAPGGSYVRGIGNGNHNVLRFNRIAVSANGTYRMVVHYANAEFRGEHDYNTNVVDRYADIRVNAQIAQRVYFRNTFGWSEYRTRVVDVAFDRGNNTIEFSNDTSEAPHIAKIDIAPPL